jgi:hypothetical protein
MQHPSADPRSAALIHIERSKWFVAQAKQLSIPNAFSALISSAVYSSRAAIECFLYWQKFGLVDGEFDVIKSEMESAIRHFKTVEYLRVHDFHRGAVIYVPGSSYNIGPFELNRGKQPKGHSAVVFGPDGIEQEAAHGGRTKADRPITIIENQVYSYSADSMIPVCLLLEEYLEDLLQYLPKLNEKFRGFQEHKQ